MAEIVKANTLPPHEHDNFCLSGPAGGGKSSLAATLPGKTLVFAFDVSARQVYRKYPHVDILEYLNEDKDLTPYSLTGEKKNPGGKLMLPGQRKETGKLYKEFARDWNRYRENGEIYKYDNVVIDSFTTLQEVTLDFMMVRNGRAGQTPEQDDYSPQMGVVTKVCDGGSALPLRFVVIIHDVFEKNEATSKMIYTLLFQGKLRNKLPNRFGHLFRCFAKPEGTGKPKFVIQTTPTRYAENIRTSYENLDPEHDVTILDHSKVQEFGLGKIIKEQKDAFTKTEVPTTNAGAEKA